MDLSQAISVEYIIPVDHCVFRSKCGLFCSRFNTTVLTFSIVHPAISAGAPILFPGAAIDRELWVERCIELSRTISVFIWSEPKMFYEDHSGPA